MVSETLEGVFRSLRLYHGPDAPRARMDALYRLFVEPGDLVFDIGAHVGDRVSSFRRLGARVVAVEPQPPLADALRIIHGRDPLVEIVAHAAGPRAGAHSLRVNTANPTVSTMSETFLTAAANAAGWEGQIWDDEVCVEMVTLDGLIARYGVPSFTKIDVEGFEDAVLCGLSRPLKALSFEFTTIARGVAMTALARLTALADFLYNFASGESQSLILGNWLPADEMASFLSNLPHAANSGDVYAVLCGRD